MMKQLICSLLIAALLWFLMFSPIISLPVSFWWAMTFSAIILITLAFILGGKQPIRIRLSEVGMGIGIAVLLWGVFWVGDKMSQWMFDFARPQVDLIYGMKDGQSPLWVSLALLLIIGPAEELFWRGYIQRTLSATYSPNVSFLVTTAVYSLVHLPSSNFMLIMAALVCGIAWGGLYRLFPHHLAAIILSHALWDAAAFVWFPF